MQTGPPEVIITVNNRIEMVAPGAKYRWPEFMQQVRADMEVPNPERGRAARYRRYVRNIPEKIVLWEYDKETDTLYLPRGYAGRLLGLMQEHQVPYQLDDARVTLPPVDFGSRIALRGYQVPAVEALVARATQGILQAPAGSGKTQMGLEVIARVGQPALWLTHTKDLAEQVLDRAAAVLDIPRQEVGMLGAGRESVGDRLTIGVLQKMARMDLKELEGRFGAVVIDEVHHSPASTWAAIINQLPARYRYGVTATFDRADGLQVITELIIGPTVHVVDRAMVEAAGGVVRPDVRPVLTVCESPAWYKYKELTREYEERLKKGQAKKGERPPVIPFGDILADVLDSFERNRMIVDLLADECPGHCSLVLSERVAHCQELMAMLEIRRPQLRAAVIHGKLGKAARREILEAMGAGALDVLFAVDIAKEGLDIPRLDRLFLVAGGRNAAEVEQKVGRVQRSCPGKADAVVFDFVDERIGVFKAQHQARRKVYKSLGLRIVS